MVRVIEKELDQKKIRFVHTQEGSYSIDISYCSFWWLLYLEEKKKNIQFCKIEKKTNWTDGKKV